MSAVYVWRKLAARGFLEARLVRLGADLFEDSRVQSRGWGLTAGEVHSPFVAIAAIISWQFIGSALSPAPKPRHSAPDASCAAAGSRDDCWRRLPGVNRARLAAAVFSGARRCGTLSPCVVLDLLGGHVGVPFVRGLRIGAADVAVPDTTAQLPRRRATPQHLLLESARFFPGPDGPELKQQ